MAAGLGLDYGVVRLGRTTDDWLLAGSWLRDQVEGILGPLVKGIEQIGSSSVPTLLAKPIADLAAGLPRDPDLTAIVDRLDSHRWTYRGDAGEDGGHVFVLEARPGHRVTHLHAVQHDGPEWRNYLRFRDLLRSSAVARHRYEAVKMRLAEEHPSTRKAYTDGKERVISELLAEQ